MNNRIHNFNVICVLIAEFAPRSRLHKPEVHAGNHPGPGHCHGLQVRLSKVCLGREWWVNKKSVSSVYSSDMMMMYCIFLFSPDSVISMSVLYVLTLHHRGDVTEKDGYVL